MLAAKSAATQSVAAAVASRAADHSCSPLAVESVISAVCLDRRSDSRFAAHFVFSTVCSAPRKSIQLVVQPVTSTAYWDRRSDSPVIAVSAAVAVVAIYSDSRKCIRFASAIAVAVSFSNSMVA